MPQVGMQQNPCSLLQCGSWALGRIPDLSVLAGLHQQEKRTRRTASVFGPLGAMQRWEQLDAESWAVKGFFG